MHRLAVGDGHHLYVEECGRPDGLPVVFLHGGPGSGCSPRHRRFFDPTRYRAILFDQRGCGRSMPLGSRRANTTPRLVADLERIRTALGIDAWLVFGGSWGSLLALAYAQRHRSRVLGLVLRGIFLASADELRRYAQGVDTPAPAAWERFAAAMPVADRDDLLAAYTRCLLSPVSSTRLRAAWHWLDYERALMGDPRLEAPPAPGQLAKTRLLAHYLAQGCFVDTEALLAGCARLQHLPAAIVQGGRDPVCPPRTALALRRAWPQALWLPVEAGGHNAFEPAMAATLLDALGQVAERAVRQD